MAKILLVEDDLGISETIKSWLEKEKHIVETTTSGREGLDLLTHYKFDLVVLDWQLPDMQGPEIAKSVRNARVDVPILMLTSKGEISDRVEGLEAGAFDYVVKPCTAEELAARVRALLRRPGGDVTDAKDLQLGDLSIDFKSHEVRKGDAKIKLSPSEFEILKLLAKNVGGSFSSEAILARLWIDKPNVSKQLVKVHVMNLRKKLGEANSEVSIMTNDLGEYFVSVS